MVKAATYLWSRTLLILAVTWIFPNTGSAQHTKIDSLRKKLLAAKEDTAKIILENKIAWSLYIIGSYDSSIKYAQSALQHAKKINFLMEEARAHNELGVCYGDNGNYALALKEHHAALKLFEKMADMKGIGNAHNNTGIVYKEQGNYPEALKEYFLALKIRETSGDKQGMAGSHLNIGLIYADQGNTAESLKEYQTALKFFKELEDKRGMGFCHNDLGILYKDQNNYSQSLQEQTAALKIYEGMDDRQGIANARNNIGEVHEALGNYPTALKEYYASLEIKEQIGDKEGTAATLVNIGQALIKMGKPGEGKQKLEKSLSLSREIGSKDRMKESYAGLIRADSALGNFKSAFENFKMYIRYKDSLLNENNTKKVVRLQMNYEFDKKQAADSIRNAEIVKQENLKHEQEIKQQKIFTYGGLAGFILMLVISIISFRAYRNKQKANEIISHQKQLVEEKQKEILDSIHYARRIQRSLLPTEKYIEKKLKG